MAPENEAMYLKLAGFYQRSSKWPEAEATLQKLSGRLIEAQEQERRHIAREIHDDLPRSFENGPSSSTPPEPVSVNVYDRWNYTLLRAGSKR